MVMYFGGVAELGDKKTIYAHPRHPYTRALMSATPALFEEDRTIKIKLQGEMPSPLNPPSGCTFHQRCPYAIERCRTGRAASAFRRWTAGLVSPRRGGGGSRCLIRGRRARSRAASRLARWRRCWRWPARSSRRPRSPWAGTPPSAVQSHAARRCRSPRARRRRRRAPIAPTARRRAVRCAAQPPRMPFYVATKGQTTLYRARHAACRLRERLSRRPAVSQADSRGARRIADAGARNLPRRSAASRRKT